MRKAVYLTVAVLLASMAPWLYAQNESLKEELQQRLASQFAVTTTTADKSDVVNAGIVLVLQKGGLLMYSVATPISPLNSYKNGKISQGFGSSFMRDLGNVMVTSANSATDIPQRRFQAGEKFWVTGCSIHEDGIVFQFYSDPYDGIRYYGQLKFPFPKGQVPSANEALRTISEVLTVQNQENVGGNAQQQLTPDQPASAQPVVHGNAFAPASPPPPPKTISLGQTKDEVVAILGKPEKVVKLQSKEILCYPDMKLTFINGKVADVQ